MKPQNHKFFQLRFESDTRSMGGDGLAGTRHSRASAKGCGFNRFEPCESCRWRREPRLVWSTTAAPQTADIRSAASRRAQWPIGDSECVYERGCRPTASAAPPTLASMPRRVMRGRYDASSLQVKPALTTATFVLPLARAVQNRSAPALVPIARIGPVASIVVSVITTVVVPIAPVWSVAAIAAVIACSAAVAAIA